MSPMGAWKSQHTTLDSHLQGCQFNPVSDMTDFSAHIKNSCVIHHPHLSIRVSVYLSTTCILHQLTYFHQTYCTPTIARGHPLLVPLIVSTQQSCELAEVGTTLPPVRG